MRVRWGSWGGYFDSSAELQVGLRFEDESCLLGSDVLEAVAASQYSGMTTTV
jgi:hypothetical protein